MVLGCVPKREEYLRWDDPIGIAIACCAAIGILLAMLAAGLLLELFCIGNTMKIC